MATERYPWRTKLYNQVYLKYLCMVVRFNGIQDCFKDLDGDRVSDLAPSVKLATLIKLEWEQLESDLLDRYFDWDYEREYGDKKAKFERPKTKLLKDFEARIDKVETLLNDSGFSEYCLTKHDIMHLKINYQCYD